MCTQKLMCNAELRPTCNETSRGFKAIELLVMLGPLFGGDGPDVWPSWKKNPNQINKKNSEQPNRLKTFRNKAHYLQNKSLAFWRDKVRHTQLLPAWQGHYATQTCFPDVQPSWDNAPARLLQPGFQTSSVILQSWCRAVSCGCWLFAARAGCASPSPVWAKPSPGSLMSKRHPASPRFPCTGLAPSRLTLVLPAL